VFRHLGDGILFHAPRGKTFPGPSGTAKKMVTVEHFWLCSRCAETMTLEVAYDERVKVIPLRDRNGAA
jgi:hypothetical protein